MGRTNQDLHLLLQNQKTKEQIESLLQNGKHKELRDRLCCRLTFGTAGLRSAMGAGFCYINDLTVIQSTQVSSVLGGDGMISQPMVASRLYHQNTI